MKKLFVSEDIKSNWTFKVAGDLMMVGAGIFAGHGLKTLLLWLY